jgi:hypothetical protein
VDILGLLGAGLGGILLHSFSLWRVQNKNSDVPRWLVHFACSPAVCS